MNRLRQITMLLSTALASVTARIVIDGPKACQRSRGCADTAAPRPLGSAQATGASARPGRLVRDPRSDPHDAEAWSFGSLHARRSRAGHAAPGIGGRVQGLPASGGKWLHYGGPPPGETVEAVGEAIDVLPAGVVRCAVGRVRGKALSGA